jgi:hypothetical protein
MEVIDHIAARVTLAAAFGAFAGVGAAMYKGHGSPPRTAALAAMSCALSATACFGSERVAAVAVARLLQTKRGTSGSELLFSNSWEVALTTHAIGGVVGGSIVGFLYLGRPLRGVAFFAPFMLVVGTGEKLLNDVRRENQERGQA